MEQNEIKSIFKNEQADINKRRADFNRLIINVINREIKKADVQVYFNKK